MAQKSPSQPSLIPAIIALIIALSLIYIFFTQLSPSRTEHTVNPAIEIVEPELPVTVIEQLVPEQNHAEIIQNEAQEFINGLAIKQTEPIIINAGQDAFARFDSKLILPKIEQRQTTLEQLKQDNSLDPDTPITLSYSSTHNTETTLAQLSDQFDDKMTLITLFDPQGETTSSPLYELLNQENVDLTQPITIIETTQHQRQITVGQLSAIDDISPQQPLVANITRGTQTIAIKDIIDNEQLADNALFYLHRVTKKDIQGLWGIIQTGLINKFRQGVRIEGINKNLIQAIIPEDADEKLPSGLSSFLGKILTNKVISSYIYNFHSDTMTHDPNKIFPGQQLILIHFTSDELATIYHFFSDKRNQGIKAFAISN